MKVAAGASKIHVLPGDVVGRIAAGEVVERPAAIVKELIENSLDAGGTVISVEVVDGGRRLITVTDNGEGMSPADVPLAFQRHATSKLRSEDDLLSIGTMGFRGEALPSIAAVSKIRLLTARRDDAVGTLSTIDGGTITKLEEVAVAHGTRIEVADLFFNTPARRKFLKATATEYSHICQTAQQIALAWPAVHFSLAHNGQEIFNYPSVATTRERLRQVYGGLLDQMAVVAAEWAGIAVHGTAITPVHARGGRSPQEIFINRRPVKNGTIAHATYDAYGASLPKGHHPLFVLFLDVDRARVDVNVHPSKREVRFAEPDGVHRAVRQAIKSAIGTLPGEAGRSIAWSGVPSIQPQDRSPGERSGLGKEPVSAGSGRASENETEPVSVFGDLRRDVHRGIQTGEETVQEPNASYVGEPASEVVPFGQVRRTFLVAQVGPELQVIDQHTAHERVLFERLARGASGQQVATQPLLIPEPIDLPPHAGVLLQECLADLSKIGLDVEPFGARGFLIRAVPAVLRHVDYPGLVQDLVEDLAEWRSTAPFEQRIRSILATLACHSAVRAGRAMALPEMTALIRDWVAEGMPTTCPHGRRIALRLPVEELEKLFHR
jgi:DNA mismatch repair protein MutL